MTKEANERLAVVEEQIINMDKKIDQYLKESREFHTELMNEIRKLDGEKVQIATLKEKVRSLEKLVWLVGTATAVALVNTIMNFITKAAK